MVPIITGDPVHDRPAKHTAEELQYDLESLHGRLLRLEHCATSPQAATAFHAAAVLVAGILWPGEVAA